ncbi:DNA polymerase III subunit delta' [Eubacteriales bacterium OttesenSCG-928-N13]|nr:DNA polymerase III subunit delta' [Eubacteriales bacterium OttesenSCG-928-N13]
MNFDDFQGLDALTQRLRADFGRGQGVHAYLFVGPRGTGKRSMAKICARALNCVGAQKPCDACPSCARSLREVHPDEVWLKKQNSIGVDDIRELIAQVMIKPFEGGRRAVVIEDAQNMTPQAQNALLKTLENPPDSAVFMLIADSMAKLLPTIVSRCRIVRFHEVDEAAFMRAISGQEIDEARKKQLFLVSGGRIGDAIQLEEDKQFWQLKDRVLHVLAQMDNAGDAGLASAQLKDEKDDARTVLDILEQQAVSRLRQDEMGTSNEKRISGQRLLQGVLHARERVNSNVVWQNVLETLCMDLSGESPVV